MKKILTILAIVASMVAANAQPQSQSAKAIASAKSAVDKAQAAVENPKQNTKTATWLKYGQTLLDAYNAPAGNFWVGMSAQELQVLGGGERPRSETQVTVGNQTLIKQEYANKNLYFNPSGTLAIIEVTQPVVDNALDKALDAFAKAGELDEKGQKTKDIKSGISSVATKFTEDAYTAYTLGDMSKSSVLFEKAVKAAATAPNSQLDTNGIYNAGFTAYAAQDWNRAKGFFEDCLKYEYYGDGGETFAKLADISDKLGDSAKARSYLDQGKAKFPTSQTILIGLINQYINEGNHDEVFALFEAAQKNEPNNASLYYVEGNTRAELGQFDEAIAAYDKASSVNPDYEYGYIGKGKLYYDTAVEIQDKASLETDDAKYMALMADFEKTLKSCIEPFEKAFEVTKDDTIKKAVAEYLKNACFRFRTEGAEYQAKYDKYNAVLNE